MLNRLLMPYKLSVIIVICCCVVRTSSSSLPTSSSSNCPDGTSNCTSSNDIAITLKSETTTITTPPKLTQSLINATEEPKGRALNFTIDENTSENILQSANHSVHDEFGDLSDVTINDDDDDDEEMVNAKILSTKSAIHNNTKGICEKGGLTYENGEKLESGCDLVCTCIDGRMDCIDRCKGPYFRRGKKIEDPLCTAKDSDDPCCSILICTADTETEPLEICSYANKTYNRGDKFYKGCDEVCRCEIAGKTSCKPRCPPVNKTSDRCVEVQDPNDSCCKTILCDVTLDDHAEKDHHKLLSAKFINSTTVELNFDPKINENDEYNFIEASDDRTNWKTYQIRFGKFVDVHEGSKFLKIENSDDIIGIQELKAENSGASGCFYKEKMLKLNEEYNDNCTSLCVCKESGVECLKLECPTYFGVDVLDPNCIEWETVPPQFVPSPPTCCPEDIRCKRNGSCIYENQLYNNWQQLPINVTGCNKRCYCEMGIIECQNVCPAVTASPPPDLPCHPQDAIVAHLPDDDCCMYWVCKAPKETTTSETKHNETEKTTEVFGLIPTKAPSKILGPLVAYTNTDNDNNNNNNNGTDFGNTHPVIQPNENPYYRKNNDKNHLPGPVNPNYKKTQDNKNQKPQKNKPVLAVPPSPPPLSLAPPNSNPEIPYNIPQQHKPQFLPNHNNQDELLQFIHQHPEIANYPSGSVLEIHNVPINSKPSFIIPSNVRPPVLPYIVPHHGGNDDVDLPPGVTLEQIIHEIQKNSPLPTNRPQILQYPNLIAPQSGIPIVNNKLNTSYHQVGPVFNYPGYQDEDITVHSLQAIDPHTVRLVFMVPAVIVGLHGRVEVRYTYHDDPDFNNWDLQVFAPPNDLIATPQLEFDLLGLKSDTEYKIKITVTMRNLHNTPTSRIYKIRTPKDTNTTTTAPQMIPIEPDLSITDINSTWVTVTWRKFTEYELQFIDGLQLRYKEIDGMVYDATPLIHRSVRSFTLENLKSNTKYEIGIYFIPFPGQLTELHAKHMLHFTTANEIDTYGFNVTLNIEHTKSTSVEISWNGVPYPEDKYVNIYRAIYQSDSGKEDQSTFKIAKRDSPTRTVIMDLKPGTRYRLWLEIYLTNGKIKTSNVQEFVTKPRAAITLGTAAASASSPQGKNIEKQGDYYGPLVIVAILASIAILSTLILLLILVRRHNQNKAAITPPNRVSQSAYDNPTYKVEIQQETMGL